MPWYQSINAKSRYAEFALGGKGSISKKNEKILSRIV